MNGIGYLGKARENKKAAAKNRPIAQWGTERLKKFVAAGQGKDWQLKNATIALRTRGVTVKQAGAPQAPPPVADDRPKVGQWTADGTRYWNGSAWVLPSSDTGGGTTNGGTTGGGTTYSGGGGSAGGGSYSSGGDWSGGGDAWGDLYGSGGASNFAPSAGSSGGTTNADGTPAAGGGVSGKTLAIVAAVGIGAYLFLRKRGRK